MNPLGAPPEAERLTSAQRRQLAAIATRLELPAHTMIYRQHATAGWVFIIESGVVKTFQDVRGGKHQITSFWFPRDIFGMAENGKYVYATQAVTKVTLYRLPVEALEPALLHDGRLQFPFLCKITHELHEAQRQRLALARCDAIGRIGLFLDMLDREGAGTDGGRTIAVPMSRADVASYLGISSYAGKRALNELRRRRIIKVRDPHTVRIVNRGRFARFVAAI